MIFFSSFISVTSVSSYAIFYAQFFEYKGSNDDWNNCIGFSWMVKHLQT